MSLYELGFYLLPDQSKRFAASPLTREKIQNPDRSSWVPLTRGLFSEGSVGQEVFPDFLEGRKRNPAVFDRLVADLWPGETAPQLFREQGRMITVRDLLSAPNDEQYEQLRETVPTLHNRVAEYVRNLAVSPAKAFIDTVLRREFVPLSNPDLEPLLEQQLFQAFQNSIEFKERHTRRKRPVHAEKWAREVEFMKARYGLVTGIPESYERIANAYGIDASRVREVLQMAEIDFRIYAEEHKLFNDVL